MAIYDNWIYEVDEGGVHTIVRSTESLYPAYLRFTNKTSRPVDVWWRDFNGRKQHYIRLEPGSYYDVNSFVTHPWQFTDASTYENYVINNNIIFRPPHYVGGMLYRTNWNISVTVRSLKRTSMLALASRLRDPNDVLRLDLPITLATELAQLVNTLQNTLPVVRANRR